MKIHQGTELEKLDGMYTVMIEDPSGMVQYVCTYVQYVCMYVYVLCMYK